MLTDFLKVDEEGFVIEPVTVEHFEDESPVAPAGCYAPYSFESVFYRPKLNKTTGEWEEGDVAFATKQKNIRAALSEIERLEKYLDDTDWFVVRKTETGKEIPVPILDEREYCRLKISELRLQIGIDNTKAE